MTKKKKNKRMYVIEEMRTGKVWLYDNFDVAYRRYNERLLKSELTYDSETDKFVRELYAFYEEKKNGERKYYELVK